MSYRSWTPQQGPDWLKDPGGQALAGEMGGVLDDQRDRLRQGVLTRFPTKGAVDPTTGQYTLAPTDAIDNIGADRKLRRGSGESDAAYAARCQVAWNDWEFGGAHYGVLRQLALAGYTGAVVVQQNGRYGELSGSSGTIADLVLGSLDDCVTRSNRPGWMCGPRDDFWSKFGLVFAADATNLQTTPGQAMLNAIVSDWMPERQFVGTVVSLTGAIFGWPTGQTYGGDGTNWGGDSIRFIPPDGSAATSSYDMGGP